MSIDMLRTGWSLGDWQRHLREMFGDVNSRRSESEIIGRLGEAMSGFARGAVREDAQSSTLLRYFSPRVMAWTLSVANRLDMALDEEVWCWYPGICAHCRETTRCTCKIGGPRRSRLADLAEIEGYQANSTKPREIREWIAMFGRIYGDSNRSLGICESLRNLYEERDELHEIVRHALTAHPVFDEDETRRRLGQELADVFAWFAAIANEKHPYIDEDMKDVYFESCPHCRHMPCKCPADFVDNRILLTRPLGDGET